MLNKRKIFKFTIRNDIFILIKKYSKRIGISDNHLVGKIIRQKIREEHLKEEAKKVKRKVQ